MKHKEYEVIIYRVLHLYIFVTCPFYVLNHEDNINNIKISYKINNMHINHECVTPSFSSSLDKSAIFYSNKRGFVIVALQT